jgi:hypothetical protein
MLGISTLAAAVLVTATATPFPIDKVSKPLSKEVAVRITLPTLEQTPN